MPTATSPEPADPEGGKRLRAAFSYAGLTKAERAKALAVGERQVTRYESGETPLPVERVDAVVEATGVPRWFFRLGFTVAPEPESPSVAERVEALEHRQGTLSEQIGEGSRFEEELRLLAARVETLEAEALGRTADKRRASGDLPQ